VVLIVLGILAVLAVLGAIVALVIYVVTTLPSKGPAQTAAAPKAEVREVERGSDHFGAPLFVGQIANTGSGAIGSVNAKLVLYDARHAALATATCAPAVGYLAPGEKIPCAFTFGAHSAFATFEATADAQPLAANEKPVKVSITAGKMNQLGSGWSIEGTLHNDASTAARTVEVFAGIAGADGRLVGAGSAMVGGVAAGGSASFHVAIAQAIAPAKTFSLRVVGLE
jgi:hypothetical protein